MRSRPRSQEDCPPADWDEHLLERAGTEGDGTGEILYGINPVREALSAGLELTRILLAEGRGGADAAELKRLAAERGTRVDIVERRALDRLCGHGRHQGVAAAVRPFAYAGIEAVLANRHPAAAEDLVLILDGILDPQNLGALIRTAHCFGANGIVIPARRASPVTAAAVKASAGAALHTPVAVEENLVRTVEMLKSRGFWVYGADASASARIGAMELSGRIALVVGAEGKGIRPLLRSKCDVLVSIPMMGKIDSLNVSVATGILLFEISKRRHI